MTLGLDTVLDQLVDTIADRVLQKLGERIGGGMTRAIAAPATEETPRGRPPTKRLVRSPKTPKALPPKRRKGGTAAQEQSLEHLVQIIQTTLQAHGSAGVKAGEMRSALGGAKPTALKRARELGILTSTGSGKATMYYSKQMKPPSPSSD